MLKASKLLILTAVLLSVTAVLWLPGIGHWLAQPPYVERVDAIVVLGGSSGRLLQGIRLYRQELAPELWHTGNVTKLTQSAVPLAIRQGVPTESIHLLPSTSTWEDGQAIVTLAKQEKVRSILVVTDWYHSRRALCVIQQQLAGSQIRVYYDPPPAPSYGPDDWWQYKQGWCTVFRELAKISSYWWQYGVVPWHC